VVRFVFSSEITAPTTGVSLPLAKALVSSRRPLSWVNSVPMVGTVMVVVLQSLKVPSVVAKVSVKLWPAWSAEGVKVNRPVPALKVLLAGRGRGAIQNWVRLVCGSAASSWRVKLEPKGAVCAASGLSRLAAMVPNCSAKAKKSAKLMVLSPLRSAGRFSPLLPNCSAKAKKSPKSTVLSPLKSAASAGYCGDRLGARDTEVEP